MTVGEAKAIARRWVDEHALEVSGLHAVFIGGSMDWVPEDAECDPFSDVDLIHVVMGDSDPALRQRKLIHEGVLLEIAYVREDEFADARKVLGSWIPPAA